ncbi:hypothetical protein F2Q68_00031880 [Brassica cretica]|uniref:Uncharacterized protein n=1 Tax=Brassica cretica TaxID=69181 RepID=A0A8S9GD17_BRACR|nr:hypothetical protein F2Q68_00031880 [Brassica cretica]
MKMMECRAVLFGPSCQPKHQTESSNRSTSTNVACSLHLPRSEFELWFNGRDERCFKAETTQGGGSGGEEDPSSCGGATEEHELRVAETQTKLERREEEETPNAITNRAFHKRCRRKIAFSD